MIQADIDFPSSLPCPQKEGKTVRTVQPFSRTTMTTGRAVQRRRFSSVPSMVQVNWVFSSVEAMAFESWFRDAINDGASWFNIDIRFPAGPGPYVARFADMYTGPDQISANHWRYSAELEVWERPLVEPGWGILPDFVAGMGIFDTAMNREWPEHNVEYDGITLLTESGFTIFNETSAPGETASPTKISELPIAHELSGDEYVPLVQDGITKRAKTVLVSDTPNPEADYLLYYNLSKD